MLRIRCKRLRYALEAVAELYGKPARVMNRRLIAVQDALGAHQDAIVAERLRSLAIEDGHDLPPATVFAMGELTARYTDRAERLRSEFPPLFRKLAGPWKELRRAMEAAAPRSHRPERHRASIPCPANRGGDGSGQGRRAQRRPQAGVTADGRDPISISSDPIS